MRLKYAALGSVVMSLLLAVAYALPSDIMRWAVPVVLTAGVLVVAVGIPRLIDNHVRPIYSLMIALPGLIALWTLTLLPEGYEFDGSAVGTRPDLWLVVLASCIALGLIVLFIVQLISGPNQTNRLAQLCLSAVAMTVGVASAGWAVIARDMVRPVHDFFGYPHQVDETISAGGFGWLSITVLAGLIIAALIRLLPWGRLAPPVLAIMLGTLTTVALNLINPLVLSVPAVVAAGVGSVLLVLTMQLVRTETLAEAPWLNGGGAVSTQPTPQPASGLVGVSFGMAPVLATGLALYFMIWLLTGIFAGRG